jgi:hypothetical protein
MRKFNSLSDDKPTSGYCTQWVLAEIVALDVAAEGYKGGATFERQFHPEMSLGTISEKGYT